MDRVSPCLLFISNGHGEDMIAQAIIDELEGKDLKFKALPLAGKGCAYDASRAERLGPKRELPSGGFACQGMGHFLKDIVRGLPGLILSQAKTMHRASSSIDLTICVGDVYTVILAGLFVRRPIVFIATYKSDYTGGYLGIERWVMRHQCQLVIPRDEPTCRSLQNSGIKTSFAGNAMMDCLKIGDEDFGLSKGVKVIGLLPGSRQEAYRNLKDMLIKLQTIIRLSKAGEGIISLLALAPSLNPDQIAKDLPRGWRLEPVLDLEREKGIVANLCSNHHIEVKVVRGRFGEVIKRSDLILGLAGTANEQAAGLGKPIITFVGHGPQTTKKRMLEQKRLLGKSILFIEGNDEAVARGTWRILHDPELIEQMGKAGGERMGPPGGAKRMANLILEVLHG